MAGNQGFGASGSHGARPTRDRDKSPYKSPCNSHLCPKPHIFKVRLDIPVSCGVAHNYATLAFRTTSGSTRSFRSFSPEPCGKQAAIGTARSAWR